ncbi:ribbon-helix-helix protein, copG family [Acidobacterium capsulatum ATCC 51196]|uniref:Ribbon-helix-helix protein, copG family n=2 Tax=Acidobacteriaceae TaxID=204434 RepID=C1F3U1_ACIC5|nr:ribbon-helix-helix protein, copG family [Acidobacterium capsulatum ATCC 51196]
MKKQSKVASAAETRVMTAHVPTALAQRVDQLAAQLERPRGWVVKQALLAWVEEEELRHRMTLEGLAAADAGELVAHEEVEKWVRSLKTNKPLPPPLA